MKATISFNKDWIFQGSGFNALTVEKTTRECLKAFPGLKVLGSSSLYEAVLELDSAMSGAEFKRALTQIIREKACSSNISDDQFSVVVYDDSGRDISDEGPSASEKPADGGIRFDDGVLSSLQALLGIHGSTSGSDKKDTPAEVVPPRTGESVSPATEPVEAAPVPQAEETAERPRHDPEAVLAKIDKLIGAADFKLLCRNIRKKCPLVIQNHTQGIFLSQAYLLSVPSGGGCSTALELLGELLFECELWDVRPEVQEFTMPSPTDQELSNRISRLIDVVGHALDNASIVSIDISEWQDRTASRDFKRILMSISEKLGKGLVVFRAHYCSDTQLDMLCSDIGDIITTHKICIPPLTAEEQKMLAGDLCREAGFTLDDSAAEIFSRKILLEAKDGYFYGTHTVKKVVNEMISCTENYCLETGTSGKEITAASLAGFIDLEQHEGVDPMETLKSLVGIEPIVAQITEIVNQLIVSRNNPGISRPSMHMRFIGNPGTGKTTVARLVGEILYTKGLLPLGKFYEHKGRDLCGRYVGETAPKTTKICQEAYGSVLFLDEAYSLFRGDQSTVDYGREALDTLVAEMENHADNLVVIMAGYPGDMDTMLEGNVGLRDRIPFTVKFPNYTREQLFEIFMRMVKKSFRYDEDLETCAKEYFLHLPDAFITQKDFGNARFVRNLFERVWGKAGMRCCAENKQIVIEAADFEAAASEFPIGAAVEKKKSPIGFAVD